MGVRTTGIICQEDTGQKEVVVGEEERRVTSCTVVSVHHGELHRALVLAQCLLSKSQSDPE